MRKPCCRFSCTRGISSVTCLFGQPPDPRSGGTIRARWRNLNGADLNTIQSWGASGFLWNGKKVYVESSQDNGLARSRDAPNLVWDSQVESGGDGGTVLFSRRPAGFGYTWGPPDPTILYAEQATGAMRWSVVTGAGTDRATGLPLIDIPGPGGVQRVADPDAKAVANGRFLTPMALSADGNVLVIGTKRVWRRGGPASGWTEVLPPRRGFDQITALAFGGLGADYSTLYVGTIKGRLWKTSDAGVNWKEITGPRGWWRRVPICAIEVDGPARNIIYVGLTDDSRRTGALARVYRSMDAGRSFQDVGAPLPRVPVFSMAIDREDPAHPVFVGNDLGVYVSRDQGHSWERFGGVADGALPVVAVSQLQVFHCAAELVAATVGRGVWVAPLNRPARPIGMQGLPAIDVPLGTFCTTVGLVGVLVSIVWGDGSGTDTTTGSVTTSGTTSTVTGSHTYASAGEYTVQATVSVGGASVVLATRALVSDASIAAAPQSLSGTAFVALTNVTVATFTDSDPSVTPSNFNATVIWGDGTQSAGVITASGGVFTVLGTHTYVNAGSYDLVVTVVSASGSYANVTGAANVSGSVTAVGIDVSGEAGNALSAVPVASFVATGGGPFTAAIDWGDGNLSAGTVTLAAGTYTVTGSNTYGAAGFFEGTVTVTNAVSTVVAVVTMRAFIAGQVLSVIGLTIVTSAGAPFTGAVLARFSSTNPASVAPDFSATVDWGDGTVAGFENDSALDRDRGRRGGRQLRGHGNSRVFSTPLLSDYCGHSG